MRQRFPPAAIALVLLAWALLFAPQLFLGRTFVLGDASVYHPFAEFSRARWLGLHERTFWNPYVNMGIPAPPSLADPRPQYLPDPLLDLYERLRTPRACPLAGPLAAHLAGMLATAALAAGLWGVGVAGMVDAALAWGLMPVLLIPLAFGHDAQFVSTSLIPVVLLGVHATVVSSRRGALAGALGLAMVVGIQCLTGHPQIIVYSGVLAAGFAVTEALRLGRPGRLGLVASALLLGAAISAAMWWPALLYSLQSFRAAGEKGLSLSEASKYSLSFRELASLPWPRAVGFGGDTYWGGARSADYSPYLGITLLGMAGWGWVVHRGGRSATACFLAGATAVSLLVSLGTNLGPAYGFLHAHVPLWSRFRVPFYALVVAQMGLALLAARAFLPARELDRPRGRLGTAPWGRAAWVVLLAAAGGAIVLGGGLALGPFSGAYAAWATASRPGMPAETAVQAARSAGIDLVVRVCLLALAVGALALVRRRGRFARAALWALPVVVALDLGSVGVPFLARSTGAPERISPPPPPPIARLAAREPWARALSVRTSIVASDARVGYAETATNFWISWRARALGGVHGAGAGIWRPVARYQLTRYPAALRAFGVVYFACDSNVVVDPALLERVSPAGVEPVYRFQRALGRAYAVPAVFALGSDEEVAYAMTDPRFDPEALAVTTDGAAAGRYPGSPGCRIRWIEDEPDRITLETNSSAAAFLVLADTFFPGWEARLDGNPVAIYRVNQLARGLAVPPGLHRVRLRYVPEGWVAATWATRAALAAWCALALGLVLTTGLAKREK